ncbi:MAG: hypothetical protein A2350_20095 [Candidatus Raymondbacteria bacterium RifOxyB12_full_50_8]|uniref:Flagellar Assembly Protein A N-terminal region domain-containing protein n=1 Tax=Candidatus Raymondbacteria bacterium RIFOXYD12_FULL_49_13 TaxID=1817890 RepID=A0A1F7F900_UNCRA|nr:MAG: hypothetical protein A2350_20095 [Candidatus Raymondbacteria bacterium RifOxyB12_full_50_8]OGK03140.1 MAG: hypothetical protein A2519_06980 [Candidatus Raymondbacteria bacterium RIFOXYD12_FULL_49_13]
MSERPIFVKPIGYIIYNIIFTAMGEKTQTRSLTFETREDGVYLVAAEYDPAAISPAAVQKELFSLGIMNADLAVIMKAAGEKRKNDVRVGPVFIRYNFSKDRHITLKNSESRAYLRISETAYDLSDRITPDDLLFLLARNNIIHGIKESEITRMARELMYGRDILVAEATLPVPGTDARIEELVPIDSTAKPLQIEGGRVDFKSLDIIKMVDERQKVCVKHPATPGTNGTSIFGQPIAALYGRDLMFSCGENMYVSEDGLSMHAACGGYLYRSGIGISVGNVYLIRGNVDYSTGNVKYKGSVIVKGSVLSGFSVESDGSILVAGDVEGARVWSRAGNVEIRKGVFGRGKAKIFAKKDVRLSFAQDADIEAGENVFATKYLLNCTVSAGTNVDVSARNAAIIGGETSAFGGIAVWNAGSEKMVSTILRIKSREQEELQERCAAFEKLREGLADELSVIAGALKTGQQLLKQVAEVRAEKKEELSVLAKKYQVVLNRIKVMDGKIEGAKAALDTAAAPGGDIRVANEVFAHVQMFLYSAVYLVQEGKKKARFYFNDGWVAAERLAEA